MRKTVVLVAFLMVTMAEVAASGLESVYTRLNLDGSCTLLEVYEDGAGGARWVCEGYKGIPVWVGEGDLRFFVSYGASGNSERAYSQTLAPFNELGSTVEWVLKQGVPIATILRWHTQISDETISGGFYKGQVLVVTQLGEGRTCHIGYIDARANSNANQLARDTVRLLGGIWDCEQPPKIIGRGGRSLGY
ncbi:hypothetical protein E1162_13650 [Rhodobacteraceae bacterium RKSG542]|uniref:hypothetical protein n=1 Tax=Pseudovibrio flavus TaxID=2529854 RepID=UPI0012BD48BC|nr:hypothetical protein [Pseudovibrio flavus]MTI18286.1 hypothetical protein [Pseudovibrio flavus]